MPRGKTLILNPGAFSGNVTFTGSASSVAGFQAASGGIFGWTNSATDATQTIDTAWVKISAGVVGLAVTAAGVATDNSANIGSATARIGNVQAVKLTIGQSVAIPVMGQVTLSGASGSASVQNTGFPAGARIFLTHQNATGTPGIARVTSSTAGTGFTITSSSTTDTSVIAWWYVPVS